MARRMEAQDADELALTDKLDIARTIVRLDHRIQVRHTLNDLEAAIKQNHAKEINSGTVTHGHVPGVDQLYDLFAGGKRPEIEESREPDGSA